MLDRASFLTSLEITPEIITPSTLASPEAQAELRWYTTLTEPKQEIATLLAPQLETYKLSATHLGNFLDVTRGGPQGFLIHTLLRFPQAMSPSAAYGSAVHATLQRAHAHLAATGKQRAIEDVLHDYEAELSQHRLNEHDIETYTQKGIDALQAFLAARYDSFTREQKVELNFAGQQSIVDGAHLTGKLDLVDIDTSQRTMTVTDYKTGKPSQAWKGATDYEKIKLHRYRQQLMFYKLLVEHSRDYGNYEVNRGVLQFVEPTKSGEILSLDDDFSHNELDDFRRLVVIVWKKITSLDLPNTSDYDPTYKGILAFEQKLLDENA
jgi:DNA helicase-2/ATP-dependent DNA helicase PcrA